MNTMRNGFRRVGADQQLVDKAFQRHELGLRTITRLVLLPHLGAEMFRNSGNLITDISTEMITRARPEI